jgi:HPr kinase/phosphorylase
MPDTPSVTVAALLGSRAEALGLRVEVLGGAAGLTRPITSPHVQKTGLAFAGYEEYLQPGRVFVLGESEVRFLERHTQEQQSVIAARTVARDPPCLLSTGRCQVPAEVVAVYDAAAIPTLHTTALTGVTIARLTALLEDSLAERCMMHAVLMDILGLGVLITGESGIGKSECALDLIGRGHRLVADDMVEVRRRAESVIIGTCPELTRHHMELRGLGLVNVRELFGIASVRSSKRVEFVVQLERWEHGRAYERLGLDDVFVEILGVKVPLVRMPVAPGRSVATLVEVAARNQLLRIRGFHAGRTLARRLEEQLRDADAPAASQPAGDEDDTLEGE